MESSRYAVGSFFAFLSSSIPLLISSFLPSLFPHCDTEGLALHCLSAHLASHFFCFSILFSYSSSLLPSYLFFPSVLSVSSYLFSRFQPIFLLHFLSSYFYSFNLNFLTSHFHFLRSSSFHVLSVHLPPSQFLSLFSHLPPNYFLLSCIFASQFFPIFPLSLCSSPVLCPHPSSF